MAPDEKALRADVAKATFRAGAGEKRWRLLGVAWPHAFITVTAKDGREFPLRFDCTGYPASPPTAGPWDTARNAVLAPDRWPRGHGGRLSAVVASLLGVAARYPFDSRRLFARTLRP